MSSGDARVHADIATFGWHVVEVPELLMLNGAGEAVRAGCTYAGGQITDDLLEGYACTFRPVPLKHYEEFLGYARW